MVNEHYIPDDWLVTPRKPDVSPCTHATYDKLELPHALKSANTSCYRRWCKIEASERTLTGPTLGRLDGSSSFPTRTRNTKKKKKRAPSGPVLRRRLLQYAAFT